MAAVLFNPKFNSERVLKKSGYSTRVVGTWTALITALTLPPEGGDFWCVLGAKAIFSPIAKRFTVHKIPTNFSDSIHIANLPALDLSLLNTAGKSNFLVVCSAIC